MNLDEAVPDHRVELLQKWMADPKLMAQAGLASTAEGHEGTFLAGKTPANIMKKRQESKAKRDAAVTDTSVANGTHSKKKKNKKNNKKALVKALEKLTGHNHKHHNQHAYSDWTVEKLDAKISEVLASYKADLESAINDIESIIAMIPNEKILVTLKGHITKNTQGVSRFIEKKQGFDETFMQIANGLYRYASSSSALKKINHKLVYPSFFNWSTELAFLQKGYFVHELLSILLIFLQRNNNIEDKTSHIKDHLHDTIHVTLKYKSNIDRKFGQLKKMKEALDAKAKVQRQENRLVNHTHLKNLRADIEEELHPDSAFKLGQPFEDY